MSVREQVEKLFWLEASQTRLTQRILEWKPGDPPIQVSPRDEFIALSGAVVALRKTLFFLAEELDRLDVAGGQTEE